MVQPLSAQTRFAPGPPAAALARCGQCFGYIHWLTRFTNRQQWTCTFCGHANTVATNATDSSPARYATPTLRQAATELRAASYESEVANEGRSRGVHRSPQGPRQHALADLSAHSAGSDRWRASSGRLADAIRAHLLAPRRPGRYPRARPPRWPAHCSAVAQNA